LDSSCSRRRARDIVSPPQDYVSAAPRSEQHHRVSCLLWSLGSSGSVRQTLSYKRREGSTESALSASRGANHKTYLSSISGSLISANVWASSPMGSGHSGSGLSLSAILIHELFQIFWTYDCSSSSTRSILPWIRMTVTKTYGRCSRNGSSSLETQSFDPASKDRSSGVSPLLASSFARVVSMT